MKHITGDVFLPANLTCLQVINTACVWFVWEQGMQSRLPKEGATNEVERRLRSWGSQLDLMEGLETSVSLSPSSPIRSYSCSPRLEARAADTSPRAAGSALLISSSEEIDVQSVDDVPSLSPQYEELVDVVTRAVAKLIINWPAVGQCHVELQRGKLDGRFLWFKTPPPHQSLPFFPDLHTEVSRSWAKPFSARLFVL